MQHWKFSSTFWKRFFTWCIQSMRLKWLIKSASPRIHNNQRFENAIHIWKSNRPMTFFLKYEDTKKSHLSHSEWNIQQLIHFNSWQNDCRFIYSFRLLVPSIIFNWYQLQMSDLLIIAKIKIDQAITFHHFEQFSRQFWHLKPNRLR